MYYYNLRVVIPGDTSLDGVRLCKAQKYRYKHLDLADLKRSLEEVCNRIMVTTAELNITSVIFRSNIYMYIYIIKAKKNNARVKLIVTDGVFSMDGDIAPLDKVIILSITNQRYTYLSPYYITNNTYSFRSRSHSRSPSPSSMDSGQFDFCYRYAI